MSTNQMFANFASEVDEIQIKLKDGTVFVANEAAMCEINVETEYAEHISGFNQFAQRYPINTKTSLTLEVGTLVVRGSEASWPVDITELKNLKRRLDI